MGEPVSAGISAVVVVIAESLVPAAFGLAMAVPALWLFNFFTNKMDNFVVEMNKSSAELIDQILKQRDKKLVGLLAQVEIFRRLVCKLPRSDAF